jgi:osmotically-inducible protein OsmY
MMQEGHFDDQWIERAVTEELEWAPHVDATHVRVAVRDGVVHLTGRVGSLAEKKAAERTVRHVSGVKGITDDLEVVRPATHMLDDAEIARRAANILAWDAQTAGADIRVEVRDGVVALTGTVAQHYQRAEAEALVQRLAGVIAVENRIAVRTSPTAVAGTRENVLRALRRHAELDASAIEVEVADGRVTLSGHVPTFTQRHIAENAAWAAQGVNEVIDNLRVDHVRTRRADSASV